MYSNERSGLCEHCVIISTKEDVVYVKERKSLCVCACMIDQCFVSSFLEACMIFHKGKGTKRAHPPAHICTCRVAGACVIPLAYHLCAYGISRVWIHHDSCHVSFTSQPHLLPSPHEVREKWGKI